jgi:tetratricopeptide (TPR) repeat protein
MRYVSILLVIFAGHATGQQSELDAGRAYYQSGEFKQAVAHFQLALHADPRSAESNYWLGRSYETLADIATPFRQKYRSLARTHLTKAAELAPGRSEYRSELFEFLLDSGRQNLARDILVRSAESDPDYEYMLARFQQTRRLNASLNAWLTKVFQLTTAWH